MHKGWFTSPSTRLISLTVNLVNWNSNWQTVQCFSCYWTPNPHVGATHFYTNEGVHRRASPSLCCKPPAQCSLSRKEVLCTCSGRWAAGKFPITHCIIIKLMVYNNYMQLIPVISFHSSSWKWRWTICPDSQFYPKENLSTAQKAKTTPWHRTSNREHKT